TASTTAEKVARVFSIFPNISLSFRLEERGREPREKEEDQDHEELGNDERRYPGKGVLEGLFGRGRRDETVHSDRRRHQSSLGRRHDEDCEPVDVEVQGLDDGD